MSLNQQIQHALKRSQWRPQRQAIALGTLGIFVTIIIGILYLSQASQTAALGRELTELIARRNNLEQVNEQLRAEIAALQNMGRLQARAQALGFAFADRSDIEYLVVDGYNPDRETQIIVREAEPEPLPVYEESFVGWLQQQMDNLRFQIEDFTNREQP
jgi:hypothetical protein